MLLVVSVITKLESDECMQEVVVTPTMHVSYASGVFTMFLSAEYH